MSDWVDSILGDVMEEVSGTPVTNPHEYPLLTVRLRGQGVAPTGKFPNRTKGGRTHYVRRPGQILVGRQNFHSGSAGIVPALDREHVTSNALSAFSAREGFDQRFVLHLLQWGRTAAAAEAMMGGTGQKEISLKRLLAVPVRVPPLAVQRRIVDVLAAVDAQIEAMSREVAAVRQFLRLRRSRLIEGDYQRVSVREAFSVLMGRQRAPQHASGPYMADYLRSANVSDGRLDLSDIKQMNFTPEERAKFILRHGDVLVSEGSASLSAVGQAAVWRGEIDGPVCFQKTLLRFRGIDETTTPSFTAHWCQWAYESGTFLRISSGTSIKHITAVRVLEVPVALPPLKTQIDIGEELDRLTGQHAALATELTRLRSFRSVLLTSLLNQDVQIPESYEVLLEAAV